MNANEIVKALRDMLPPQVDYGELTKPVGDGPETYTTGYHAGHKNGQAELIAYILQLDVGSRAEAEAALKGAEHDRD